jgi:chromosome partitioning protein
MIIALVNTKGGVGKSTIAVHLAVALFDVGRTVALVDADTQRSSSEWLQEVEQGIAVRTANTPEQCLAVVQELRAEYEFVIGDGPGGLDEVSRALLLLADVALFPITPSILDLRSVTQATGILRFAQGINGGRPEGRLVLNKLRRRGKTSNELRVAAPSLGVAVASAVIHELEVYRDAAQQGTVAARLGARGALAAAEIAALAEELIAGTGRQVGNG